MSEVRLGLSRDALPFQVFFACMLPKEPDGLLEEGRSDCLAAESLPNIIRPPSLVALRLRLIRFPLSSLFRRTPGPEFHAGLEGDFSSGNEVFFDFLLTKNGLLRESMKGIFDLGVLELILFCFCEGGDQVLVASVKGYDGVVVVGLVGDRGGVLTESSVDIEDPSDDICVMEDSGRSKTSAVSTSRPFFAKVGFLVRGSVRGAVLP